MLKKTLLLFVLLFPLFSYSQPYLEDGLVAFWPFNGNANDYSGFNHNGVAYGVWPVNDHNAVANHAYYFDGLASIVNVAEDKFVTSLLSVSFFIRITESHAFNFAMACSDFSVFTEADSVGIIISLPAQKMVRGYSQIDKWTHVVGTYDNSDIRIYIDGVIVDSIYHPGIIHDMDWNMIMGGFGSNYWTGELDDIRIYSRVLSPDEVGQLFDYYGVEEDGAVQSQSVWPQPCSGMLNFSVAGNTAPEVSLFSMDGRCVFQMARPEMTDQGTCRIDVSGLLPGIYLMECKTDEYRLCRKIIIVR